MPCRARPVATLYLANKSAETHGHAFIDIVRSGTWRGFTQLTRSYLISRIVLYVCPFVESYSLYFRLQTMLSQTIRLCARD